MTLVSSGRASFWLIRLVAGTGLDRQDAHGGALVAEKVFELLESKRGGAQHHGPDKRAAPLRGRHQPFVQQDVDGPAYRHGADRIAFAKLGLGRQAIAGTERARANLPAEDTG